MPQALPVLVVGALGAVLFALAGVTGLRHPGPDGLQPHLVLALAATLAWLFSQTWVAIYTFSSVGPAARRGPLSQQMSQLARLRREGWIWPLASTLLVAAAFATGASVLTRALPALAHLALALAASGAQIAALWREAVLLGRHRRLLQALDAA